MGPLVLAAAVFAVIAEAGGAAADLPDGARCRPRDDGALRVSPASVVAGAPVRVLLATDRVGTGPIGLLLTTDAAPLLPIPFELQRFEGPPGGLVAALPAAPHGGFRVIVLAGGRPVSCDPVAVFDEPPTPTPRPRRAAVWQTRGRWDADSEDLFSLWVAHLFTAPREAEVSWPRLAAVLADPARNALHGHLGLGEDAEGLGLRPDCADFPYVLRAYFAWKLGLPMGYRRCTRGSRRLSPRCEVTLVTNAERGASRDPVEAFRSFVGRMRGAIHASSPRPDPASDASDLYPIALTRDALRPGAVYADPYGHVMMVATWYPQTATTPGALMAVDAQPDETVGRRLFWRGNFLFPPDDGVRGAGWRRFRPLRLDAGQPHVMPGNAALASDPDYGDVSLAQWEGGREAFYEAMDALANPLPMAASVAVAAVLEALAQQVNRRVEAVAAADRWFADPRGRPVEPIAMPETAGGLFLTTGPWEDFSTPSRDLRLLIALDVVRELPARLARNPSRFTNDLETSGGVEAHLGARLAATSFSYGRSDGRPQTLTLAALRARAEALEVGWNPNDCPEHRWGAARGSDEARSCRRRAPNAQRTRMDKDLRRYFARRERP